MKFTEYLRLTESVNTVQPKNSSELKKIVEDTIEKEGKACDLNFIDTSKIKVMYKLFEGSDFDGDISEWDVSSVENMKYMFINCPLEKNAEFQPNV